MKIEQLIEDHLDDLYGFAVRLCGNKHSAEDLVQDLFLNLSQKNINTAYIKNPRSWLASILYRLFVDHWRHENRSPLLYLHQTKTESDSLTDNPVEQAASADLGPENLASLNEQQQRLIYALDELNDKHKHLLIMHDMHGYTLNEVAVILGVPLGTLKSRLHRAREKLKKVLETMEPIALFIRSNK